MSIQVSVSSFRKIKEEDDSYTAFTVDVWVSGIHHIIEKRYSEFEKLHQMLKKVTKTPEFPPKKVLKWNPKVLEQRRQGLDAYFKGLLEQETIPHALLLFLEADAANYTIDRFMQDGEQKTTHQPALVLDSSVYLQKRNSLPNIVTEGVLVGLYTPGSFDLPR
ncbi:sorting nexin-24-like [Plakobranchus ocellatus]|uniref:Sorting nexin-24-like n=1 Tax=Plakobranchus ocellatus TaxID=259542 RepID=A0AAV4CX43_9GAST|nr:sorting nexin-24-like [Plakobranchus ocellatus]